MRYRKLYDGKEIPAVGLGTWTIGGGVSGDRGRDKEHLKILRRALEMGYSHIDTAEFYADGHAEELVGRAIREHCRQSGSGRGDVFVTSKVWRTNLRYRDVLRAMEGTLRRLDMDFVDLYLVHWPNSAVPMTETFNAMNELLHGGSARYIGVSNFSVEQLKEAQALSSVPIATNQVAYHLQERRPEKSGLLRFCQEQRILLTAYQPLGKGGLMRDPALMELAGESGFTPAQLAIAWLLSREKVIAIPMSSRQDHLQENLGAAEIDLPEEIYQSLEKLG